MRVLEPKELEERRHHRVKKQMAKRRKSRLVPFCLLVIAVYIVTVLAVPLPNLQTEAIQIKLPPAQTVSMPWPAYGQAAIGAVGYGLLAQNGEQKPIPTASMAKVVTAVAVLKVRPIPANGQGELITVTAEDIATYERYYAEGQSVIKVEAGEQLTQYQALQALLLPSANNMADILVRWAFGSNDNYLAFVNPFTKTLGMTQTNIADASGFSPATTSTAVDLAILAEIAMNHPVISEIVGQTEAELPVAGKVQNSNNLLGQQGMVGIKTGTTDEAGGCYMFAAKLSVAPGHSVTVVGVIMGATQRAVAMADSLPLLDEAFKHFQITNPLHAGDEVGTIVQNGGEQVPIVLRSGGSFATWAEQTIKAEFKPIRLKSTIQTGEEAGTVLLHVGNMTHELPAMAGGTIGGRSMLWRIRHAGGYL